MSIQEILPIQRIPLRGPKSRIADNPPQLFFRGAVVHTGGSHYVFFQHDGAYVVAAEAEAHLADFQALRDPARLHIQKVREIEAGDGQDFEVVDGGGFVPVAATEGGVVGLKAPGDEGGEAAGFFLQIVEGLQVVNAVFVVFADTEHHCGGGAHADLVGSAVNVDPVGGEAFEARDFVADFVVENFGAAPGDGVESGVAQAEDGVANGEVAVFGDGDDFRRGVAVQMHLRKTLADAAQHFLVPVDLEVGMQASLHEHAGAAEFDGLADFFVDGVEVENVAVCGGGAFQRAVEGAEGAIFGAEVGVVDVAVDDVGDHALGMFGAADSVGFHADADEVVGVEQRERLSVGQGHG